MLIETKNVLQIMSINWYFINFIFSFLKIFKESGLKFSKWNLINNTLHLNLFIPPIFWNLSGEKNGAIFLIIKDHLHPTEIIIWVAPRSNLMLFFWGWCSAKVSPLVVAAKKGRLLRRLRERLREPDENSYDQQFQRQQSLHAFCSYKKRSY